MSERQALAYSRLMTRGTKIITRPRGNGLKPSGSTTVKAGGEYEYDKAVIFINHYQPVIDDVTLALRSRLETSRVDVPFFDLPILQMSGFSRDRYRDQHTISFHAEGRYKFRPRWGVVGFYEFGWFNDDFNELLTGRRITSYGGGVRWQVTEQKQMHLGVDVAFSTDDNAVYVQIGERF